LLLHPEVELCRVASVDHVGEPLSRRTPTSRGLSSLVFENLPPEQAAQGMDVVLLGLPHKISAQKVPAIIETGTRIVDLSGDFRLRDAAAYEKYYGAKHPSVHLLGQFVYGLPSSTASASAARAGRLARLLRHHHRCWRCCRWRARACSTARSKWWVSPARRAPGVIPTATTHHPTRAVNLRTYKPLEHQHIPRSARP